VAFRGPKSREGLPQALAAALAELAAEAAALAAAEFPAAAAALAAALACDKRSQVNIMAMKSVQPGYQCYIPNSQ
jgi:hypothetical protein